MKKLIFALMSLILIVNTTGASAGSLAQSLRTNTTSSATWSIAAVGAGQSPSYQPLTLTWYVSAGTAYQYFAFNNLGTTTVNGFLVTVSQTASVKNGQVNDVYFERCLNGTWNTATNTCSGTVLLMGKATDQLFSFPNAALSTNAGISMRARTPPNSRNTYVTTISTSVSRLDVRPAVAVHS